MDILSKFGFDIKIFSGQIINFLILVFIFKKFLYKPILQVLKDRESRIRKSLDDAEKTKIILDKTIQEKDEILKKTRLEAEDILENTKRIAEKVKEEIILGSKAESDKIILQAKEQASLEMGKMEKQIKTMSLDLSQKILLNIIPSIFESHDKDRILKKAMEKMKENSIE